MSTSTFNDKTSRFSNNILLNGNLKTGLSISSLQAISLLQAVSLWIRCQLKLFLKYQTTYYFTFHKAKVY